MSHQCDGSALVTTYPISAGLTRAAVQGMGVLHIDTAANVGTCTEPNVWVRHAWPTHGSGRLGGLLIE